MDDLPSQKKRSRVDSDESPGSAADSTKVKRIRDDLLSLLDDSDPVPEERDSLSYDLDSVIRSFEEEISGSGSSSPVLNPANLVDLTADSGEFVPESGEFDKDEFTRVSTGIGELWEFQDDLPSYDPFEFGLDYEEDSLVVGDVDNRANGNGYLALDGIFDYPDTNFGSDFSWRSETLPAL